MKTMLRSLLTTTALSAALVAAPAFAAIDIDADGFGFIGKGDVQTAFDWNDRQLQANAATLLFRLGGGGRVDWDCIHTNPAGHVVRNPRYNISAGGLLDVEARYNPQGKVTGFFALGFADGGSGGGEGHPLWSCPPGNDSVVDPDSIVYSGGGSGSGLAVSANGGASWVPLQ